MKRLGGFLLALSMFLGVGLTPADALTNDSAGGSSVFNVPPPWGDHGQAYKIIYTVEQAMRDMPTWSGPQDGPRPIMLITSYLFDRGQSSDAMIAACKKGVSVRVILDSDITSGAEQRLVTALNSDNITTQGDAPKTGPCNTALPDSDPVPTLTDAQAQTSVTEPTEESYTWGSDASYVKKCRGSCRGAGGNMHSKFYAFSQTAGAHDVVMVSSSNLNSGGALRGWNDMYIMRGRPASFDMYRQIHRQMTDDVQANGDKVEFVDGPYTSRFFPMKNADASNDPTMEDLNKVRCASDFGRTKINVSMFYWAGTRGMYIAKKLVSLAKQGCRVAAIYGAPSKEVRLYLRKFAANRLIRIYDSRWDLNHDGYSEVRTHGKYVLVRGTYGADRSASVVMTGTANWVAGSLSKGDENSLNIELPGAYNAYIGDWEKVRKHSRQIPQ